MTITLFADALVATLLVATIVTCYVLSKRIERLKADEGAMRQTIGALISATDTAERAIAGLKSTLNDCDRTLADSNLPDDTKPGKLLVTGQAHILLMNSFSAAETIELDWRKMQPQTQDLKGRFV